ncbi:hypothetical protein RNJ44_00601 [Nakaseomyces bracarensis]|uniref:Protein kinase domain-containing protein n=1 Tax=Nakaseomyces bracarensis TaxID=273131 RepID=A0ABR4NRJ6_9SACH
MDVAIEEGLGDYSSDYGSFLKNNKLRSDSDSEQEKALQCKYVIRKDEDPLGDGHFSVVKECMNMHTKDLFAMKLIDKSIVQDKLKLIQREFELLKYISETIRTLELSSTSSLLHGVSGGNCSHFDGHHHILQLYDFFETSKNIVLITQLCQKDDLYDTIIKNQHLDLETQVKPYTACMVSALDFLHSNGIVHRDIKAENVLFRLKRQRYTSETGENNSYDLSAHDLILADFGLATRVNIESTTTLREYVGTISYIAPEIVACKNVSSINSTEEIEKIPKYSTPVDIWALGVLTYFMALGYTPFDCETDDETIDCISKVDYYIDEDDQKNPKFSTFWDFLEVCFEKDQEKRPTAKDLKTHPFLKEFFKATPVSSSYNFMDRRKTLKRNHSTNSFHLLRSPLTKNSSANSALSSAASLSPSPSMSQTNLLSAVTARSQKPETKNLRRSAHSSHSNLQQLNNGSRDKSLKSIKDTLQRTLSMTSLKPNNSGSNLGSMSPSKSASLVKKNSTFVLDPKPPMGSLMNGCFSTTPESKSNFSTPRVLSRKNSATSLGPSSAQKSTRVSSSGTHTNITNNDSGVIMNVKPSILHTNSTPNVKTMDNPHKIMDVDEDDEDDDEMGIVI